MSHLFVGSICCTFNLELIPSNDGCRSHACYTWHARFVAACWPRKGTPSHHTVLSNFAPGMPHLFLCCSRVVSSCLHDMLVHLVILRDHAACLCVALSQGRIQCSLELSLLCFLATMCVQDDQLQAIHSITCGDCMTWLARDAIAYTCCAHKQQCCQQGGLARIASAVK